MSENPLDDFEEATLKVMGAPLYQVVQNMQYVYEGLEGSPAFIEMMQQCLLEPPESKTHQMAAKLDAEVPKIADVIEGFQDFLDKSQTSADVSKEALLAEYDDFMRAVHDLKRAYHDANVCYALTFSEKAEQPDYQPPFQWQSSLQLGEIAHALPTSHDDGNEMVHTEHSLLEDGAGEEGYPDYNIGTEGLSVKHMSRDTPYMRAIKAYLTFESLVAEPEFGKLKRLVCGEGKFTSEEEKSRFGITEQMQEEYFKYFESMDAAAGVIQHLVLDEYGERRTRDNAVKLEPEVKETALWLDKELPAYVAFLNETYATVFDKDNVSPVFDLHISQKVAVTTMAQFLAQREHHGSWGHRYN